jgi:hypothetical protein
MKKVAALLFVSSLTVVSIAAVNAAPRKPVAEPKADVVNINRCNVNLWPGLSATPCHPPPGIEHYADCLALTLKGGWAPAEGRWYCSSVHFKS